MYTILTVADELTFFCLFLTVNRESLTNFHTLTYLSLDKKKTKHVIYLKLLS